MNGEAKSIPAGCASFRVEWDERRHLRLVLVIPCPMRREIDRVEQLVRELNAVRFGEAEG